MTALKALFKDGKTLTEVLFLAAFTCYVIFFYLQSTTFMLQIPGISYGIIRGVLMMCTVYRLYAFRTELSSPVKVILASMIGLGLFYYTSRGDFFVLDAALMMGGAVNVSFKRIGIVYVYTGTFISLLALVASQVGIIPDYVFQTNYGEGDRIRHSFGIIYPTDFYAHLFYLAIIYFFIRWKRVTYLEIALASAIFAVAYHYTSARVDMIGAVIMLLVIFVCKISGFKEIKVKEGFKKVLVSLFMPVCALAITVLTYIYNPEDPRLYVLDSKMSYRLSLGKTGMGLYGFKLFGNAGFAENGNANGGIRNYTYVFYDSAYIKYLFKYGMVLLIVLFVVYALIGIRLTKQKMFYGCLFLGIIAVSYIIEHHMLELSYNITLLLLTSDISTILQLRAPININNKNDIMSKTT